MSLENCLIELGTEELPALQLPLLIQSFSELLLAELKKNGVTPKQHKVYATPRRLAVFLEALPGEQSVQTIRKKGPSLDRAFEANGTPTKAAMGFAKSCGCTVEELDKLETPQGTWLHFEQQVAPKALAPIVQSALIQTLDKMPIPKRMRWGDNDYAFIRPIHWIVAIHGAKVLEIECYGIKASNVTFGHRVHHSKAIILENADDYASRLYDAKVIACPKERKDKIVKDIEKLALTRDATARLGDALVTEVSNLVEWPVIHLGHFDKTFLTVPKEALITAMEHHQRCFALEDKNNQLINEFIITSNVETKNPKQIISGNERVMLARLQDAKFFFEQDIKTPLSERRIALKNIVFQKKLGTYWDKTERVYKLVEAICLQLAIDPKEPLRAAKLYKNDLLSEMVYEFPDLQGVMGTHYATHDGEAPAVANAIQESYYPRFSSDSLPTSEAGTVLALADRIDTLIGIFGAGMAPTGDKDPFAIRRCALAILRILVEKKLPLDLSWLYEQAQANLKLNIDDSCTSQALEFTFDRFKAWYADKGIAPQTIEAVMACQTTNPLDFSLRLEGVTQFNGLPEATSLSQANKRVRNILLKNGISHNSAVQHPVNPELFQEQAESMLYQELERLEETTKELFQNGQYANALSALAALKQPIDQFFDDVMVMVEDENIQKNRIHLIGNLYNLFMKGADISKLSK